VIGGKAAAVSRSANSPKKTPAISSLALALAAVPMYADIQTTISNIPHMVSAWNNAMRTSDAPTSNGAPMVAAGYVLSFIPNSFRALHQLGGPSNLAMAVWRSLRLMGLTGSNVGPMSNPILPTTKSLAQAPAAAPMYGHTRITISRQIPHLP